MPRRETQSGGYASEDKKKKKSLAVAVDAFSVQLLCTPYSLLYSLTCWYATWAMGIKTQFARMCLSEVWGTTYATRHVARCVWQRKTIKWNELSLSHFTLLQCNNRACGPFGSQPWIFWQCLSTMGCQKSVSYAAEHKAAAYYSQQPSAY